VATMPELVVSVRVKLSLWDAIKLRIAGLSAEKLLQDSAVKVEP
jgi:hypothetical protein